MAFILTDAVFTPELAARQERHDEAIKAAASIDGAV